MPAVTGEAYADRAVRPPFITEVAGIRAVEKTGFVVPPRRSAIAGWRYTGGLGCQGFGAGVGGGVPEVVSGRALSVQVCVGVSGTVRSG